jgi:outer membrane biogenesis lipoprotein LolB
VTRIATLALSLVLSLVAACAGRSPSPPNEPADHSDVIVQIINHSFNDMDVYATTGAGGSRLGFATGHKVSVFRVPWKRLDRASRFRLSVDPIGRGGRLFSSYLAVEPGSLVTWTLEPNLSSSNISVY